MKTIATTKEYKQWRSDLQHGARRLTRYSKICAWAERRRTESFKNTRFYCCFWVLLALAYLLGYFLTRDYYHGWYGVLCTFFDVSVFNGIRADWSLVWKIGKLLSQLGGIVLIVFSVITLFKKGIKAKYFEFAYYSQSAGYMENQHTFVYYFDAIVRTIGYRQISYRNMGNVEHDDGALKGKEGTYILPSRLIYDYDDRSYRFTYKALDLPLELEGWDRLTLRAEDDLRNYSVVRESSKNTENEKAV